MPFDKRVLHLAQLGDETAFEELVRYHQNLVYTLALRILANPDDALDVSQDVFVRVWRTLPRFEGRSELSTWLYRVTANICLDSIKKHRRERERCTPFQEEEQPSGDENHGGDFPIEEELDRLDLKDHVDEVLWRMNDKYRSVLVLRDIYGFSYEEVATTLKISLAAAKIRIYRARLDFKSRYRQQLKKEEK
jgi:RNA polymerase sigma-70 factor (ECF subfamily)